MVLMRLEGPVTKRIIRPRQRVFKRQNWSLRNYWPIARGQDKIIVSPEQQQAKTNPAPLPQLPPPSSDQIHEH